jgi:hypothetical protein
VQPHERFARNLREQQLRVALSQQALGLACDLDPTEIRRLERAVRESRLSTRTTLFVAIRHDGHLSGCASRGRRSRSARGR